MLLRKSKNVMSACADLFITEYALIHNTHKIFVEFGVSDYIELKKKKTNLFLPPFLEKRAGRLTFDFYDSTTDTVFEVNGSQHYSFNPFFHRDIGNFDRQRSNDFLKRAICEFYETDIHFINAEKDLKL